MIGRQFEKQIILKAIKSQKAELGVIYGRRRVGKSFLLKSLMRKQGDFYFEGVKGLSESAQIEHFLEQMAVQSGSLPLKANTWKQVFEGFTQCIKHKECYVVFDELPWMASQKTELISWIKYFWDNFWKNNNKLTLILCGSVANFMVRHVVHSEALHNRKTFEFILEPLLAAEARLFFHKNKSLIEVSKYLMIFGGVPKYLEQIDIHSSLNQNIDRLCFQKGGFFLEEFDTIFKEQFKVIKNYESIVRLLVHKEQSKEKLSEAIRKNTGGSFSSALDNLVNAGFIRKRNSLSWDDHAKDKTVKYVLWDEWIKFYFNFMSPNMKVIKLNTKAGLFEKLTQNKLNPFWGRCFERLIEKNLPTLLNNLNLDLGDIVDYGPFFKQGVRRQTLKSCGGAQVDLLLKRRDKTICIIESKFTDKPVGMEVVREMNRKVEQLGIPKKWSIETVLISAAGATAEVEDSEFFNKILDINSLY